MAQAETILQENVGVDGPLTVSLKPQEREPSMEKMRRIGMNTSKPIFQLHGVDEGGKTVLRKKLGRKAMVAFFETLPATVVGIEVCGGSHHWGRLLSGLAMR